MRREAEGWFSGVLLVARDGEVAFHRAYGMANREKKVPMRPDTILAIGSTPIDFTKAGILLLAERRKLGLDDPIAKHLGEVPGDKRAITIRHLMTGRSGLPDFHDAPGDRDPDHAWIDRAEAVRRILNQGLLFSPGQGQRHSHSAWGLLAAVIELVSGRTYPEFTRENLFKPAGMVDTGFFGEPYPEERMAVDYGPRRDGEVNAPPFWGPTSWLVMGSGGQVSTAMDIWRWLRAVHGGKLLSADSLRLYAGPGLGILAGGDRYGFEIQYAGDHRRAFVLMSNVASRETRPRLESLAESLLGLIGGAEGRPRFTMGARLDAQEGGRVTIVELAPGGAAARGGLRPGDRLISANGRPLGDAPLAVLGPLLQSGEPIRLEIERDGRRQTVTVRPVAR